MTRLGGHCPSCSADILRDARFCTQCGTSIGQSEAPGASPVISILGDHRTGSGSWKDLGQLFLFYGLYLGTSLISGIVAQFHRGTKASVAFSCIWAAITFGFLIKNWSKVQRVFRLRRPKPKTLLELLLATTGVVVFLNLYFSSFRFFGWPLVKMTETFTKAHWPQWAMLLVISVGPVIFEEIAFRGIFQTKLSEILSAKEALIIQAALFSVLHLSPLIFVSHFVMGLLLGWVRLRSGHVYFGMLLHIAWNGMVVFKELG